MDRGGRSVRAVWVAGFVSLLLVVGAVPARAAFPGRNGLLVAEPASGPGLIVVGTGGAHPRRICTAGCYGARDPVWSPDGSEIAVASPLGLGQGSAPSVIYPDGSCLACSVPAPGAGYDLQASWDPNVGPGFLPDGRLAVVTGDLELGAINEDGIGFQPFVSVPVSGFWRQPAWSSTGQLAVVQLASGKPEVFVINPVTGSAHQLTGDGASSPTWSPDGRRLAAVHGGWIELIGSRGGRVRRLTRGRAPAWSPDGTKLAFVGAHNRLSVIAARGGRPRLVGHIRAQRVDWQPITGQPPSRCQAPAGSSVVAASPDATVSIDPAPLTRSVFSGHPNDAFSVLGCQASDGRERLLEHFSTSDYGGTFAVGPVVVAGAYAALVNEFISSRFADSASNTVAVFDLRTGSAVADRGGESAGCSPYTLYEVCGVDKLVLGADAVTAAHTFVSATCASPSCTTVEQIVANDRTGTHTLDTITTPGPFNPSRPSALSQLALSGHTLTWDHAGTPESAQLN